MSIPHEQIDPDAEKVVKRLTRNNFAAYLVGGCVRDLLLGRTPKDFDVATSATPQEIKALFRNCRIIGRRFRLAHVFFGSKIIETSTFRANPTEAEPDDLVQNVPEGAALPPAEPAELLIRRDNVFGTEAEDARRRDFTINGLFYDLDADKVIDYVEGLPDLEKRTVRTIGDPQIRFREDPVRILRAIKFAARLDFTIEPASYQAILDHKGEIAKCAPPRVLEEIYRLLRGAAARRSLELLVETGVLDVLIPELAKRLRNDEAVRDRLLVTLDHVDDWVRAGGTPTNALLLSAMLAPFLLDFLYEQELPGSPRIDPFQLLEERVRPILDGMRSSRRDTERGRQILLAQRRLMPSRRRRSRPMALVRRDWFDEALALFQIMHPSPQGEVADELARWHRLRHEGHAPPPHHGQEHHGQEHHAQEHHGQEHHAQEQHGHDHADGDGQPKRRRRRRGGRRRRRPANAGAPAANGTSTATAAPADGSPAEIAAKPDEDKNYGW